MAKGAEIGVANMFRFVFLFFGGCKTVFFVVGELGNLIPNLSFCEKTIHPKFCIMYRDSAIYVWSVMDCSSVDPKNPDTSLE